MKIKVNGKDQSIQENAVSVSELLKRNEVESIEMVSVQLNGNFIDKNDFDKISLIENDELDFLYFMGGGEK
ncbi:MAG: sulfur carrier protein ThiS [Bacteroidales bacterium]|nr:sulfur carrier protein ThiS [Bacteroidales bacterium]